MGKRGKRYTALLEKVDRERLYKPGEALRLVKELASSGFDETIELNLRLGVDPSKADQQVRGSVSLPKGTGRDVRVAVFAQGEKVKEAEAAGADHVGGEDLAERIEGGWLEFDAAIATPDMMPVVGKLGKILGPRGLMPNPKSGTVTMDIAKGVQDVKAGRIEYRTDRQANIHTVIGKASFPLESLVENYLAVVDEILRAKPAAAKGRYVTSITLSPSMGPGIRIDPSSPRDLDLSAGERKTEEPEATAQPA